MPPSKPLRMRTIYYGEQTMHNGSMHNSMYVIKYVFVVHNCSFAITRIVSQSSRRF
jgi:hypothetical protein